MGISTAAPIAAPTAHDTAQVSSSTTLSSKACTAVQELSFTSLPRLIPKASSVSVAETQKARRRDAPVRCGASEAEYRAKRDEMAATLAAIEGMGTPAIHRLLIMNWPPPER